MFLGLRGVVILDGGLMLRGELGTLVVFTLGEGFVIFLGIAVSDADGLVNEVFFNEVACETLFRTVLFVMTFGDWSFDTRGEGIVLPLETFCVLGVLSLGILEDVDLTAHPDIGGVT